MINPQAAESMILGLNQALEDAQTLESFRNGELSFLLDCTGITLLERGPHRPPWPEIVTEVSNN